MKTRGSLFFPPFRLDVEGEQLWREDEIIALRPKTFAVLRYLVEHPGQLVTKDELLDVVWAGTVVSDTVLKSCIRELGEALGDDAQNPRYIATVHRRGYRFLPAVTTQPVQSPKSKVQSQGEVVSSQQPVVSREEAKQKANGKNQKPVLSIVEGAKINSEYLTPNTQHPAPVLVGREAELGQLHNLLAKALNNERQVVFVTGEAGIGKTTLIDVFLHSLESRVQEPESQNTDPRPLTPDPWVSRGQCIEQYGAGSFYKPKEQRTGRMARLRCATDSSMPCIKK